MRDGGGRRAPMRTARPASPAGAHGARAFGPDRAGTAPVAPACIVVRHRPSPSPCRPPPRREPLQ